MSVELPSEMFVKPIDGQDDTFAFRFDFNVEGKALEDGAKDATVTELENGDLLIEGMAAVFDGVDRQGENFIPGAFQRGIKSFLENGSPLNFHHKHDHGIGKVLDLNETPAGLRMKARVDFQPESSPLRYIYNAVKKGTYKGLSVGGFFKRKLTDAGYRIADMDFTEISVTPVAVHPKTSFAVVAGKALQDIEIPEKPNLDEQDEIRAEDERQIKYLIRELDGIFTRLGRRGEGQNQAESSILL